MSEPITSFSGEFRFLSNFWPVEVALDGQVYCTVENAYQAAKTLDPQHRKLIRLCFSPGRAKRLGRSAPLRDGWEDMKLDVMLNLTRQKYDHGELRERLLKTGTAEIVEGNTWNDTFWGVCRGKGENHLGRILMQVRGELKWPEFN